MLTKPPDCRSVCDQRPGAIMDELVASLARMRAQGLTEATALVLVGDPDRLMELFPEGSLGRFENVARSFIDSGCASCAVNKAFSG